MDLRDAVNRLVELGGSARLSEAISQIFLYGNEEQQGAFETLLAFIPALRESAKTAQNLAISYRNFLVGCAVLAAEPLDESLEQYRIFLGYNVKVNPDARPICAEQIAVHSARAAGYQRIFAIALEGTPQEDHGSGLHGLALEPCQECRVTLPNVPSVRPDTYLIVAHPNGGLWQISFFRELVEAHKNQGASNDWWYTYGHLA